MTSIPHLCLTLLLTWTDLTYRHKRDFCLGYLRQIYVKKDTAPLSPIAWSSHRVKQSVSASLALEVFMMSECTAESAVYRDYDPTLHRRRSITLPDEPTVTFMKADSAIHLDLSTVCIVDVQSAFDRVKQEHRSSYRTEFFNIFLWFQTQATWLRIDKMTPHQCQNVCDWETTERDQPSEAQLSLPRMHTSKVRKKNHHTACGHTLSKGGEASFRPSELYTQTKRHTCEKKEHPHSEKGTRCSNCNKSRGNQTGQLKIRKTRKEPHQTAHRTDKKHGKVHSPVQ